MKVAVLHGPRDIRVEDAAYPTLEPGAVIMKVRDCGICGSDLHVYRHGGAVMRLGHEFSGDIVEVGSGVEGVKVGERVVAMSGRGCGRCYWCKQGQWIRCSQMSLLGYEVPGALAEYVLVPSFNLGQYAVRLPEGLTYEQGALAEPLSVAKYAVEQAQPRPDETVVVIGLGIIGLFILQILKSMGVSQVIASGRREKRLQLAKQVGGASVVVDAANEDVVPVVSRVTADKGADVVFEVAGTELTFQQATRSVHRGGRVELVGLFEEDFKWNPSFLVSNDIALIGCGLRFDIPGAIGLLEAGAIETEPLISHQFPLSDVKRAFDTQLGADDAIKVLVKP